MTRTPVGGVLNLTLGSTMTTEECLEIVKKLDDISQNKFYTINVYDTVKKLYVGDFELLVIGTDNYTLIQSFITGEGNIGRLKYIFYFNGDYSRLAVSYGTITSIVNRLDKIEQQLGI